MREFYSELGEVEYGVPKPSILGPILFSVFVNGLFILDTEGTILSYADDTAVFYTAHSWQQSETKVNDER